MTRRPALLYLLPVLTAGALALAAPAAVQADETNSATTPATSSATSSPLAITETQTGSTAGEAPAPTSSTAGSPEGAPAAEAPPQVQAEHPQGASASGSPTAHAKHKSPSTAPAGPAGAAPEGAAGVRAKKRAPAPSTLTPSLPLNLRSSIFGVPAFFIESFQIPPFLLPIFQAAGTAYGVPWQVLAAINEVETDYGRDLSVSSAGAEGWMQFLPSEWAQYGVDANGDGFEDPYNPADAIFAAARYLRAAGGDTNVKAAVFSYNHSQAYVESVMLRAQLLGGTPSELLGAITGLTEARFPVHAASHYSDGFPTVSAGGSKPTTLVGTTIYSQAGAPVIAVQDGEVVQVGDSPSLGRFVTLRDAYGNTYVYAELGDIAPVYPVLEPRVHTAPSPRVAPRPSEPTPSGPATAGAQPRSPLSEGAAISGLALGAAAGLEADPVPTPSAPAATQVPPPRKATANVRVFTEGANDVYLHPLVPGVQVIAGTVLGHVGAGTTAGAPAGGEEAAPHIVFQMRPAGSGAPLIDPKPILDGWVALEDTSIFRAKGENPFLATSPTVGQVLLESKQQLEPQVLHGGGVRLGGCARQDVQEGRVDKRVLAMLEYLSVSGLRPTVSGLPCAAQTPAALAANAPAGASAAAVQITAVNGVPVAGHQGAGSIADTTVRKLLMLQGLARPKRIVSLMSYPGAAAAQTSPHAGDAIHVSFAALGAGGAGAAAQSASGLSPSEWIELLDRLGEIPDPTVGSGHSSAAMPDAAGTSSTTQEGQAHGND
ncbi:MAG TPA: lytic murein transglycosylase [Solirubrobacteraceae bacterium]|jgi:membrane-bound lytic murein transglycosylase B|nr:lytic murein transglycosylase [Solirubrobacteraceae bacterium]